MGACKRCNFFVHDGEAKYGRCHRYPPQRITVTAVYGLMVGSSTRMPRMPPEAWCGEFRPRERDDGR